MEDKYYLYIFPCTPPFWYTISSLHPSISQNRANIARILMSELPSFINSDPKEEKAQI